MKDARAEFKPVADRIRKNRRILAGVVACLFTLAVVSAMFQIRFLFLAVWLAFAGGFAFLVFSAVAVDRPRCPACLGEVLSALGSHCPECGSTSRSARTGLRHPCCLDCGKVLATGRSRGYRIKVCTHCGSRLDDIGL